MRMITIEEIGSSSRSLWSKSYLHMDGVGCSLSPLVAFEWRIWAVSATERSSLNESFSAIARRTVSYFGLFSSPARLLQKYGMTRKCWSGGWIASSAFKYKNAR